MLRREFTGGLIASLALAGTALDRKQRVDRALQGKDVDRTPFSLWHHFGLKTPEEHATATLEFHRNYRTDFVKVMSDFPYPQPNGKWYEPRVEANPFPRQLRALELIRQGLNGDAYFIETVFNPWNVAEKLSSKEELNRLRAEQPQKLLDALDVITQSEINHVKLALKTGASGILVSVANANRQELSPEDYRKFSEPFDRRIIAAAAVAPLTMLHLHVEPAYLDFFQGFKAPIINYSDAVSGIPVATVRSRFSEVIAGGIDEVHYRELDTAKLRAQYESARKAAGAKFILTPGCSVPNDSSPVELARLPQLLGA